MMNQTILDNIIRRIVEVAHPEKIILFGSAARGEMNRHSDVDLLIVKACVHRPSLARHETPEAIWHKDVRGFAHRQARGCRTLQGQPRADHDARAAGRKGHL